MIVYKDSGLNKKEISKIKSTIDEITDIYSDFYITKNNLRLFIKENFEIVEKDLKNGDKVAYEENNGCILIIGYSDKVDRKYLKILTKNNQVTDKLLQIIFFNVKEPLYVKIKKNNPNVEVLLSHGFYQMGDRGKEVLLYREPKIQDKKI